MTRRRMTLGLFALVGLVLAAPVTSLAKGKKKGGRNKRLGRKNAREHTAGHTGIVTRLGDSEDVEERHADIRARHEAAMAAQRGQ